MGVRLHALIVVLALVAAKPVPVARSSELWATINVCDTPARPDTIGIRGSMPGRARRTTMMMRFRVQWLSTEDGTWHYVETNGDSGWKVVGRTRRKAIESGQDFTFLAPVAGTTHHLRGVVRFKWTRRHRVVAHARRLTEGGHRSTAGADPDGYSAAVCDIS